MDELLEMIEWMDECNKAILKSMLVFNRQMLRLFYDERNLGTRSDVMGSRETPIDTVAGLFDCTDRFGEGTNKLVT